MGTVLGKGVHEESKVDWSQVLTVVIYGVGMEVDLVVVNGLELV